MWYLLSLILVCAVVHCSGRPNEECSIELIESIPENLTYPSGESSYPSTFTAWNWLMNNTKSTLDIASFYWTLLGKDVIEDPSDWQGEAVFKKLMSLGNEQGGDLSIRVAASKPQKSKTTEDLTLLNATQHAHVRYIDFDKLIGRGILHTKLWLVDGQHGYLGSANMDWRSLTQVKELGVLIRSCPLLVKDLQKVYEAYWYLAREDAKIPSTWPAEYNTLFNSSNPMKLNLGLDQYSRVYVGSSPPRFCPSGRSTDLSAILLSIKSANKFIDIAVMDYLSLTLAYSSKVQDKYWPVLNDALLSAAIDRHVNIRLLVSHWNHTRRETFNVLRSIKAMDKVNKANIQIKLFTVPAFTKAQAKIPFSRVNHNKYMVTDKDAFIGTSNWSGDYFNFTGGLGLVVSPVEDNEKSLRTQLQNLFMRDWDSKYSKTFY